ncbi:MAG: V-type ATP synthase subunit I, partial [Nanoarchaeota archaeon]
SKKFLDTHEEEIIKLENKHTQLSEKEVEILDFKAVVNIFNKLDIPVELLENGERIHIITGKISNDLIGKLEKELYSKLEDHVYIIKRQQNKKETIITIAGLKENQSDINFLIKKYNVHLFTIPDWGIMKAPAQFVESELNKIKDEKESIIKKVTILNKKLLKDTIVLREELEVLKQRYEAVHNMLDSEKFFITQGWILKKDASNFENLLKETVKNNIAVLIEEPKAEENVPVELANSKFVKPFEMLTELYALPKYRDLDPTFIVGPIFLIFAAFMLTDAVYGLFLVIMGLFLLKKFAKYNEGMRNVAIIILGMGTLTVIFGILTGSYFGDLPKYLWGVSADELAFWKDPLADPLYFLIVAIGTAVVYLNIGFIFGVIEDHRKKDYKTMFKDRIVWFIIQIGIALLVLKMNPVLFKLFGQNIGLATLIIIFAVVSIIITHGPLGLLGITGLMGDMISFSRLFALSLSTAGIALAVNLLANLVRGIPYVGIIAAAVIFIIGHMFGFVMNSIGSFVHSLRLQFVEFFGRFYEGGGDKFVPLKEERYYTEVEK